MNRRKRNVIIGVCVSVCLIASAAGAWEITAAHGRHVSGDLSSSRNSVGESPIDDFAATVGVEFLNNQEILDSFGDWIVSQPGADKSGYIDQINDSNTLSVRLLWYKTDPLLDQTLEHAAKLGIKTTVEHRSMSRQQIQRVQQTIWTNASKYLKEGFAVKSIDGIGVLDDGLDVMGTYVGSLAAATGKAVTPAQQRARQSLQTSIDETVNVNIALVEEDIVDTGTRLKDTSPFSAGGLFAFKTPVDTGRCSTGFSVNYKGVKYATTAQHCAGGSSYTAADSSTSYGSIYKDFTIGGFALFTSSGKGMMYDGAWNNTAGYAKPVKGSVTVHLNDLVCTSGGNSGVHCDVKVDKTNISYKDSTGKPAFITYQAVQTGGKIAGAQGDSGGPVLTVLANGYVGAAGMMQAMGNALPTASCGSMRFPGSCSKTILFTPIGSFSDNLVDIVKG